MGWATNLNLVEPRLSPRSRSIVVVIGEVPSPPSQFIDLPMQTVSLEVDTEGSPSPTGTAFSVADELKKLKKLSDIKDSGLLTEEEFAAQKARLLTQ